MKSPQGKVDEFRCGLNPDRDAEFIRIASRPNQNITTIHRWLCDEGYKGSYQSVCNWYSGWKKNGEKAERLNQLTQTYVGVVPEQTLAKIVVEFSGILDIFMEQILTAPSEEIKPGDYLKQLPHVAREIRSCAEAIHQLKYLGDRKEIEMSGVYRLQQELLLTFLDTPFEQSLTEALKGAIARLEAEN